MAGRPRGPRPGGAARAGGGREAGGGLRPALPYCPEVGAPRSCRLGAQLGSRESGFSGMCPGGRSWRGGKRRSTFSLRPRPEPFGRGSAAAPGFLPRGWGAGRRAWGWSPARWVSSRPGRLLHRGCNPGGNLAAAPRDLWASPRTPSRSCPLQAVFLFVCVCAFLLSNLLGNTSGWECVIMPQGNGGLEEVKNVFR